MSQSTERDPKYAEPHVEQLMDSGPREDKSQLGKAKSDNVRSEFLPRVLFAHPAYLECALCHGQKFLIYLSQGEPFVQFKCATVTASGGCPGFWPAYQLMVPQMTAEVEKRMGRGGLVVPPAGMRLPMIDEVVDIPNPKRVRALQ